MPWQEDRKGFISVISRCLEEIGAIERREVRLASGQTSNLYIDLRRLFGSPKCFAQIISIFEKLILKEIHQFDGFAAVPTAGLPFATALALKFNKPFFYARTAKKEHGLHEMIEGGAVEGLKLVVIDDLISSGYSKLPAIETLRNAGATVDDTCVLIDRELGGQATLEQIGIKLHAVVLVSELF
ncbi:MAG: orotate phosphoribosyltransferase [Candidatus Hodarchaeales archaeon]|jgi:uridine monophosphate synthetase